MIMVRDVLHCRPGQVRALVEQFQAVNEVIGEMGHPTFRVYTDLSGERFWTAVLEAEYESLETFQEAMSVVMSDERTKKAMAGYHELVDSGRRELYNVET